MSQKNKRRATGQPTNGESKAWMVVPVAVVVMALLICGVSSGLFHPSPRPSESTASTGSNAPREIVTLPPINTNSAASGQPPIPESAANEPDLGPTEKAARLQNHGNDLLNEGKFAEAVADYQAAAKLTPEDEDAHYNLAFALAKSGDREGAKREYLEALRIYPDYTEAHNNLGNILLAEKKYEEAVTHFKAAKQLTADDPLTQNNLGHGLALQGKLDEAIPCFKEALRLKPDFVEARNNLAVGYIQLKKPKEAIAEFEEILRANPDFEPAKKGLARARKLLGP